MMSQWQGSSPDHVALFGGACDPLTVAHGIICDAVANKTGWPVWMMPCWGHKFGKQPTPAEHRWSMLQRLADINKNIIPFEWEIARKHTGSMYETLQSLRSTFPYTTFHVVIGMDNANSIHEWDRGDKLIEEYPFIVSTRKGYEAVEGWFLQEPHMLVEVDIELSSTTIRKAIENGDYEFAKRSVSSTIWEYIQEHKLYGYK